MADTAYPEIIQSGSVLIPASTLRDYLNDNVVADVPGLLEKIDLEKIDIV